MPQFNECSWFLMTLKTSFLLFLVSLLISSVSFFQKSFSKNINLFNFTIVL